MKQCLIGDRGNGVNFSVRAAKLLVEAFSDNFAVADNNRAHHRIRAHTAGTLGSKLQTTAHIEKMIAL